MNSIAWLEKLVRIDTTSRNSNMELINAVVDWLKAHQFECHLVHDPVEPKANLFATLVPANGRKDGGLILSGHSDVVPVDGQQWSSDPFVLTQRDNRLYGRGTADMKGFIAVVLSLVPKFKTMALTKPLHIALSYDEEIGCRGAPFMIADLPNTGFQPSACVVGEPTEMSPIVAHKGKQSFRCEIHGRAAHSSLTNMGCNAIEYAARMICFIRELAETYKHHGPFDPAYDVPYTTLTTNLIKGGNATNTIPALCEFVFEFRNLHEVPAQEIENRLATFIDNELLPRMRHDFPESAIKLNKFAGAPGLKQMEADEITKLVRSITKDMGVRKAAYATEGGLFQQAGIPTILCGPGSIEQAHRPDEYVAIEQLVKCEAFLESLVRA